MHFPQKQTERNAIWLIIGICGISLLAWLINSYTPTLWSIIVFFVLLFTTASFLTFFLLKNVRQALLIGAGTSGFFFLRALGLREPFYFILLAACLLSLEVYLNKR